MTLFLGLEWFSISLYILCALDTHREASLEAGLKYLIVGSFGSAILLFGSALVYGATGELGFGGDRGRERRRRLPAPRRRARDADRRASGSRPRRRRSTCGRRTSTRVRRPPVTAFMAAATKVAALVLTLRILVVAFPEQEHLWTIAIAVLACVSLAVGNLGRARAAEREAPARVLVRLARRLHADRDRRGQRARRARALLYYLIPYGRDVDRRVRRRCGARSASSGRR